MVGRTCCQGTEIAPVNPARADEPKAEIALAYGSGAESWDRGAVPVYGPLARALLDRCPIPLVGLHVLDVGAGTGVASEMIVERGAKATAVDLTVGMLTYNQDQRPPGVAADVTALPFPAGAFDVAVAAFVLNHIGCPVDGLRELRRVVRPGGVVLATVFSSEDRPPAKDRIDAVATAYGWKVPEWYLFAKKVAPLLGTAGDMRRAALDSGLVDVVSTDERIGVGADSPEDAVHFRLSQAHLQSFVRDLDATRRAQLVADATAAVSDLDEPMRPAVVFLAARSGHAM